MTPYQRLELAYWQHTEKHPESKALSLHVQQNLIHGFVFSRPDFFVMGRPVVRTAPEAQIVDNEHAFFWPDCDCWYIDAMSGNMADVWCILPWPLPWMCFGRWLTDNLGLRFYRSEVLKRFSELLTPIGEPIYGRQTKYAQSQPGPNYPGGAASHTNGR